jgi:predicted transcriptional regulator of viral defense system
MGRETKELLRRLARASRGGLVSVARSAVALGVPRTSAAARLASLERQGWVRRLRRGWYLVLPLEASAKQPVAIEDPWILARELFSPCYIGGWSAAEYWGLTEQLFRSTFVVTAANARSTTEQILGAEFRLVRVAPRRIRNVTTVWRGRERVDVSDAERTLADGLISPEWVGGVRHLADIMMRYRESRGANLEKLIACLDELGRGAGFKRLGYLIETLFPEDHALAEKVHPRRSQGIIKLDPSVRARGRLNKRWGLWVNVPLMGERT